MQLIDLIKPLLKQIVSDIRLCALFETGYRVISLSAYNGEVIVFPLSSFQPAR